MRDDTVLPFPVAGAIRATTLRQLAGGQPELLLGDDGDPAAVILDADSWDEAALLLGGVRPTAVIVDLDSWRRAERAVTDEA